MAVCVFSLAVGLFGLCCSGASVVTLPFGDVLGVVSAEGTSFFGIPYARPPVGELRWKPSSLWTASFPAGTLDATNNTLRTCPQPAGADLPNHDEDCLVLNVFVPASAATTAGAPVAVWVHGGGAVRGSGTAVNGLAFANATGAVVVTLNYRLGILGGLALAELFDESNSTGNYGLLDQLTALKWVHNYISAFGGNASRVTLMGQSAGGAAVLTHLTVRLQDAPLFSAAIVQSGPLGCQPLAYAEGLGNAIVKKSPCANSSNILACMRQLSASSLITLAGTSAWPSVADSTIVKSTDLAGLLESGMFHKMPVLIGTTASEASDMAFQQYGFLNSSSYEAAVRAQPSFAANEEYIARALELYPPVPGNGDSRSAMADLMSDSTFTCNIRASARALSGSVNVFMYRFHGEPVCPSNPNKGSFHGAELVYEFGHPFFPEPTDCTVPPEESSIVLSIRNVFGSFIQAGAPLGVPAWSTASQKNVNLDVPETVGTDLREEYCDFWDRVWAGENLQDSSSATEDETDSDSDATSSAALLVVSNSVVLAAAAVAFL